MFNPQIGLEFINFSEDQEHMRETIKNANSGLWLDLVGLSWDLEIYISRMHISLTA
jgi:hypothetical protein